MNKDLRYEFYIGDWLVEPALSRLSQGEKQVSLRPKVMDLLVYLSIKKDTVVSQDELMEAVWGGTIVSDSSIYCCVNLLREALGDDKNQPEYIETISKRGYRLIADVEKKPKDERALHGLADTLQEDVGDTPTRQSPRFKFISVIAIMASILVGAYVHSISPLATSTPTAKPSIAVLAFSDFSPDGDQEYFADGISDEIINLLVQTNTMQVTGSTSSFSFKGKAIGLVNIARQLNVGHILEGSISKSGNIVKITAQLNDSTGVHLWSETYKRELSDIFEVQEEIAAAIIRALQAELLGDITTVHINSTENMEAFDLYLKGLHASRINSFDSYAMSREYLEKSIDLDPDFLLAKLLLVSVIIDQVSTGAVKAEPNLNLATTMTENILIENQDTPEVYIAMSDVMRVKGDEIGSLKVIEKARDLGANSAEFYYGYAWALRANGRIDDAIKKYLHAIQLDPIDIRNYEEIAGAYQISGQIDQALINLKKASVMSPESPVAWAYLADLTVKYEADFTAAIIYDLKSIDADPTDPELIDWLTAKYISLEEFKSAQMWADHSSKLGIGTGLPALYKAQLLFVTGQRQKAIDLIEKTLLNSAINHRWGSKVRLVRKAASIYTAMGNYDAAEAIFLKWIPKLKSLQGAPTIISDSSFDMKERALSHGDTIISPEIVAELTAIYRLMGRDFEADRLIRHIAYITPDYILAHRHKELLNWDYVSLAGYAAAAERTGEALALLEKAVDNHALYEWQEKYQYNPALYSLHKEPRFIALIDRIQAEMARQRGLIQNANNST